MEIGVSWNAFKGENLSNEKQADLLLENGFTHTFLMANDPDVDTVVPYLKERGIVCDSFHAPFKGINNIWLEGEKGSKMLSDLLLSVDACAKNGVPVLVTHLSSGDNCPRITDTGYFRFKELVDYADKKGVVIAFENQRKLANLAFALEEFPSAGFCWDVGHEACFAYGREYMPLFASRLAAVHIHDNSRIKDEDLHMIPYDCKIDFTKTARHFAKSAWNGALMLELHSAVSGAYDNMSADEYFERAGKAARRLAREIEEIRQKECSL